MKVAEPVLVSLSALVALQVTVENGAVYNRDGKTNESVSTGINQVGSKKAPAKLKIYSINGVKVAEVNKVSDAEYVLAPGMYICNGKKFVIK